MPPILFLQAYPLPLAIYLQFTVFTITFLYCYSRECWKKHIYRNISLIKKLNLYNFSKSLNLFLVKLYSRDEENEFVSKSKKLAVLFLADLFSRVLLLSISHVMLWKATQKAASAH